MATVQWSFLVHLSIWPEYSCEGPPATLNSFHSGKIDLSASMVVKQPEAVPRTLGYTYEKTGIRLCPVAGEWKKLAVHVNLAQLEIPL